MRKTLAVLIITFWCALSYSAEMTSELTLLTDPSKKLPSSAEVYGMLFARPYKTEDMIADLQLKLENEKLRINTANIKFFRKHFDITAGRQLMAWGSGYNFNPTDIFNSKPLGAAFDPGYYKNGRDALLLTYYLGDTALDLIYAASYRLKSGLDDKTTVTEKGNSGSGIRVKSNIAGFDMAISFSDAGKKEYNSAPEAGDDICGLSLKGSLPEIDWGIWFEGAYFTDRKLKEWVTGLEYVYDKFSLNIEYYYNGFGNDKKALYDTGLLLRGRLMGKNYMIPSFSWTFNEYMTGTFFTFSNLNDSGSVSGGVIDYLYSDNIEIALMPFYISGKPDSEFGMQKAISGNYGAQGMLKITF